MLCCEQAELWCPGCRRGGTPAEPFEESQSPSWGSWNHPEWLTNIGGLGLHLKPQLRAVYYTSQSDPMLGYCLKGLRGAFSHPWNFPELHSCTNISQFPSTFSLFWSCNPSGVFWSKNILVTGRGGGNPPQISYLLILGFRIIWLKDLWFLKPFLPYSRFKVFFLGFWKRNFDGGSE